MAVEDIIREQDELKAHTYKFALWKRKWQEFTPLIVYNWQLVKLSVAEQGNIPDSPGIYSLLIQPGIATHPGCSYLMYIGKSVSLRKRFSNYLHSEKRETGRPKVFRFLNMYPDNVWFCFTGVSADQLKNVEDVLLETLIPPANDQLPASIRLVVGAFQ